MGLFEIAFTCIALTSLLQCAAHTAKKLARQEATQKASRKRR